MQKKEKVMKKLIGIMGLLSLVSGAQLGAAEPTTLYEKTLATSTRPAADKEVDFRRHPEKVLAFFQVQPGQRVLDLFSGGGYYTELTSIIVGEDGQVDAHNNTAYIKYIGEDKLLKRYENHRLNNVSQLHQEGNDLDLCTACYDRVLMILTYHDLYYVDEKSGWPAIDAQSVLNKVRNALKPDGLVGIIDHTAPSGASIDTAQTLHRIDPQIIKDNMANWGFVLKAQADFLANPADTGELPMWDESVRGHTDRAVLLFGLK
jgi:predicted methyltransferase